MPTARSFFTSLKRCSAASSFVGDQTLSRTLDLSGEAPAWEKRRSLPGWERKPACCAELSRMWVLDSNSDIPEICAMIPRLYKAFLRLSPTFKKIGIKDRVTGGSEEGCRT